MKSFQQIREVINQWDPIGLLELNPIEDEYDTEVREIEKALESSLDVDSLAEAIKASFEKWFTDDFQRPLSECKEIAVKILES